MGNVQISPKGRNKIKSLTKEKPNIVVGYIYESQVNDRQ